MGSIKQAKLNRLARKIWDWCELRNIWIHETYIASKCNLADSDSRVISLETEWQLGDGFFQIILQQFGQPVIDLFASNINAKYRLYISWHRDPGSLAVDAFTTDWSEHYFYAFPPFSLVLRVLNKVIADKANGIVVVPYWPSQASCMEPILLGPAKNLLSSHF